MRQQLSKEAVVSDKFVEWLEINLAISTINGHHLPPALSRIQKSPKSVPALSFRALVLP